MTKSRSWRDVLPIHSAAEMFPLMAPEELRALGEDIKKNGLTQPIVLFKDRLLLDGRNRLDAMELVGIKFEVWREDKSRFELSSAEVELPWGGGFRFLAGADDPYAFVISANIHRRHLTAEQKRELIAQLLKVDPTKSNRQIAETVRASHPHVAKVRSELEKSGDVETVTTSIDTKGRAQPAHKPAMTTKAEPEHYSVQAWEALSTSDRKRIIAAASGNSQFNAQDNDSIEWARWSWNPVTGCLHDCKYCYARDIAERFYEQGFEPTFLPNRLIAPSNTKVPKQATTEIGFRNVFVCSMADLFGKWVPEDWIEAVFDQVRMHPQWNFLFLTKFPQRLAEREWPVNAWCGTTVDTQARVKIAERAFRDVKAGVRWLSVEPMMERLTFTSLEMFNWIVIGGAARSTRTSAFNPPMEWVLHLLQQADAAGIESVYAKANLRALRGYPTAGISTLSAMLDAPLLAATEPAPAVIGGRP